MLKISKSNLISSCWELSLARFYYEL